MAILKRINAWMHKVEINYKNDVIVNFHYFQRAILKDVGNRAKHWTVKRYKKASVHTAKVYTFD